MNILKAIVIGVLTLPFMALQAADNTVPLRWHVTTITVNPATQGQFEQMAVLYKAASEKVGDEPAWYAYSSGIGNTAMYTFASPITSYGMFADPADVVMRAFGAEKAAEAASLAQASISDMTTAVYILRPELGIAAADPDAVKEAVVTYQFVIKNGMEQQWETGMKQLVEAHKKIGTNGHWQAFSGGFGAAGRFGIRAAVDWAELDVVGKRIPQILTEAYGARAAAKMMAANQEALESMEVTVERFRLDLSHLPASQ